MSMLAVRSTDDPHFGARAQRLRMASPFFLRETGLLKQFGLVTPRERVAMFLRIFRGLEFRQSFSFLPPAPVIAVVHGFEANPLSVRRIFRLFLWNAAGSGRRKRTIALRVPMNENKEQAMVLRTALMSLAAFAVCQIGYGQSGTPQGPAANASPRAVRPVANQAATVAPVPAPAAMANGPQMDYGMSTMPAEEFSTGAGLQRRFLCSRPDELQPLVAPHLRLVLLEMPRPAQSVEPAGQPDAAHPVLQRPGAPTTTSARTIGSTFLPSRRRSPTTTAIRGTRTITAWSSTDCTTGCDSRGTPRSATRTTETPTRGTTAPARRRFALTAGLNRLQARRAQDRPGHSRRTRAGGAGTHRTGRRRHHRPPDRNSWTSGRSPPPVPARSE